MAYEEKRVWVMLVLAVVTYAVYLGIILSQATTTAITEVDYVAPMLWTIAISIAASIVIHILIGIMSPRPQAREKKDQRDREIDRFGEFNAHGVLVLGAVIALVLAILEQPYFWISNSIYLAFVVSAIVASSAKLVAYRSGMPW